MDHQTAPVQRRQEDDILILTINNPPVNTLAQAVRAGLQDALRAADADPSVKAVVLTSAGRMFSAGAEIREFGGPKREPALGDVIAQIEKMSKPVIAAIHGSALGGGLELTLGCHARVAASGAKLGLPEVKIGLLPGGGGTQRLPRLAGPEAALKIITEGEPVSAEKALKLEIIDAVATGDLLAEATAFAKKAVADGRKFVLAKDRKDALVRQNPEAFQAALEAVSKRARGQRAPVLCAEAVRNAVNLSFEDGLKRERELFTELVGGDQSKALRYVFFAEREAQKVPGVGPDVKVPKTAKAAVIGAGTMGGGIAMCFANVGIPVTIVDLNEEALQRGIKRCADNWRRTMESGKMSADEMQRRVGLMSGATDLAAIADADVVIEAVFEDMGVKQKIFADIDRLAKPGALLATNTSTLDVDKIAQATRRPQDVIGLHFFSPANVMRLLEIIRGKDTSAQAIAWSVELGRVLKKVPVVVGNCDGFVGNRMLGKRGNQGEALLQEGALPQQVDAVLTKFGLAMGPFAVGDLSGLDIGASVRKARGVTYPIADAIVAAGRLGQKTGKGWYRYSEGSRKPEPDPDVQKLIEDTSARLGITRREISNEEILDRMILPLVNEGARILEEGIALRASDIDTVWVNGYGWPTWTGGPMYYADQRGLKVVRDRLAAYAEKTGDPALKPAPLLEKLAAEGGKFTA